jgi:hypothetical protein
VNLGQGFPDFDGPDFVKEAASAALNGGAALNQYTRFLPLLVPSFCTPFLLFLIFLFSLLLFLSLFLFLPPSSHYPSPSFFPLFLFGTYLAVRSGGHPRLVQALSTFYSPLFGRKIDPMEEIVTGVGASECILFYCSKWKLI